MRRETFAEVSREFERYRRQQKRRTEPLGEPVLQGQCGTRTFRWRKQFSDSIQHSFFVPVVVKLECGGISFNCLIFNVVESPFEANFFFSDADF